ncbi:hypothetical protein EYC80_005069 [Monilinia laxa]|uniref:Uncharacterized protein n=1 Tax=Monilinia laxa TaxID=61186 RepID=A0A5N6KKF4_MONLA|nr:hypothetical protein EYC80_005069 [Monilinia laxa]
MKIDYSIPRPTHLYVPLVHYIVFTLRGKKRSPGHHTREICSLSHQASRTRIIQGPVSGCFASLHRLPTNRTTAKETPKS